MLSPYRGRPRKTYWKTGVQITGPVSPPGLYTKKWEISREDRIATAGSCFAQHIGKNLKKHGFAIMDVEPAPSVREALKEPFGYGLFSARYGNVYTARQMLQLAQEAFGLRPTPDHIAWSNDNGRWFDALRPGVERDGLDSVEEVFAHRDQHLAAVRRMLVEMDVLVFTLGLTEAWLHADGTVLPTAPGVIAGSFDAEIHRFHNFTYPEVLADMEALFALLNVQRERSTRYLLTVSPVPLAATATDAHVMVATAHSKATLRAVAGTLALRPEVDYFPSFEIISNPWSPRPFYQSDLREPTPQGVATVMSLFAEAHLGVEPPLPAMPSTPPNEADDGAKCEEALLEAFAETAR